MWLKAGASSEQCALTFDYFYARFVFVSYMNVVALSHLATKAAGDNQTAVQKGHAATPSKLRSSLTLQTWETPETTATYKPQRKSVSGFLLQMSGTIQKVSL